MLLRYEGHEPVPVGKIGEIRLDEFQDEPIPKYSDLWKSIDKALSIQFRLPKCKTRKRFVKLLMSKGISRNTANEFAEKCKEANLSWKAAIAAAFLWW